MAVTDADAIRAIKEVLDRYGSYLPGGIADSIRSKPSTSVIQILAAEDYCPLFDQYYRSFFAAINSKALRTTKEMIDIAKSPDAVCGSFNCPAFTSPAIKVTDRVIYVNRDEDNNYATLCHELCHYISHGNFYPEFYAMGGENPNIVEGITEYLTRSVSRDVAKVRREKGKYQRVFDQVNTALIKGSQGDLAVIRFALQGQYTPLQGLVSVPPGRAPTS